MNSQLRNIRDKIRPLASGPVGSALDLLLELCIAQQTTINDQGKRIQELEAKANRHSGNSSMSPSSDKPWRSPKKRSLREASDKKRGDQVGHRGQGGKISDHPDEIVPCVVDRCPDCDHDLSGVAVEEVKVKQLGDIPPVRPKVTEYQVHAKCCPACQKRVRSSACPIHHQMVFGPRLKAFCVYLSSYQLLPCERTSELLQGMLSVRVSMGSLDNFRRNCARLLGPFADRLKATVIEA